MRRRAAVLVAGLASGGHACGSVPADLWAWTAYYAQGFGLDPHLLAALVWTESRYCAHAVSPVGAIGLGQLMPGTARELGVDPRDPVQNLYGAAKYLRARWDQFQDWNLALAAYNAGPGAVRKYGGVPPFKETRNYVVKVLETYASLKGAGGRPRPAAFANVPTGQLPQVAQARPAAQATVTRVAAGAQGSSVQVSSAHASGVQGSVAQAASVRPTAGRSGPDPGVAGPQPVRTASGVQRSPAGAGTAAVAAEPAGVVTAEETGVLTVVSVASAPPPSGLAVYRSTDSTGGGAASALMVIRPAPAPALLDDAFEGEVYAEPLLPDESPGEAAPGPIVLDIPLGEVNSEAP